MTVDEANPTLTQFTDPMCTWCWGSEPVMRHRPRGFRGVRQEQGRPAGRHCCAAWQSRPRRRREVASPIAVYYSLTEKGQALWPVLDELGDWAGEWVDDVPTDVGARPRPR